MYKWSSGGKSTLCTNGAVEVNLRYVQMEQWWYIYVMYKLSSGGISTLCTNGAVEVNLRYVQIEQWR